MKSSAIIFIALSLIVIGKTSGQTYQGFPTGDGYWKVEYGYVSCLDIHQVSMVCSQYQYIFSGDTMINYQIYHEINLSGRDRNHIDETWTYWDSGYHGCYRNDLTNKVVFYIPKDSLNEVLLYDFNLNLNDTLPETYVYNQAIYTTITVDLIDSILVNNTYLKRYYLDSAGFSGKYASRIILYQN